MMTKKMYFCDEKDEKQWTKVLSKRDKVRASALPAQRVRVARASALRLPLLVAVAV